MLPRHEFVQQLMHMPFARLVEFILWNNHGDMDIQPDDFTMAMVVDILSGDDFEYFAHDYARFLEVTE